MSTKLVITTAVAVYLSVSAPHILSHGGRLNSEGCHNQTSDGTYHCHRGPLAGRSFASRSQTEATSESSSNTLSRAYNRDDYLESWSDEDGDCQNLRHELLIEQSLIDVTFASARRCNVITGRWLDPYSGNLITQASDLDVDHVIPLSYAHENGGFSWPTFLQREFAQDRKNLLLVTDSINQSKGAKGPSSFLPWEEFQCEYAEIWQYVSAKYELRLRSEDITAIRRILQAC
jgi:hypothetical protein